MRAFALSNTAFDLRANEIPLGSTVVVNGANGLILQGSADAAFTTPYTIATTTTAAPWQTAVLVHPTTKEAAAYVRVSTSAVMSMLYN